MIYSLVGDALPASQRSFVAASVGTSGNIGVAVGSMLSGFIGTDGSWRTPYCIAAFFQLSILILVQTFLKDTSRSNNNTTRFSKKVADHTIAWSGHSKASYREWQASAAHSHYLRAEDLELEKFSTILAVRSNCYLLLQALLGCVPVSLILVFLPDFLITDNGMSVGGTMVIQAAFGVSGMLFTFLGSSIGSMLYDKSDKRVFCRFLSVSNILGVFPFLLLINLPTAWLVSNPNQGVTWLALLLTLLGGVVAIPGPNVRATLMALNDSSRRGTAMSALTLADDLGKGFGPPVIVSLVALFGRRFAFSLVFCLWWGSAALFWGGLGDSLGADAHKMAMGLPGDIV